MNVSDDDAKVFRFRIGQLVRICGEPGRQFVVFERRVQHPSPGCFPRVQYLVRMPFTEDANSQHPLYTTGCWMLDIDLAAWEGQL